MEMLDGDNAYLTEKGLPFQFLADGENGAILFKDYPLAAGKYDRDRTDLLICIPKGYNDAKLDNFYVDPPLKLASGGNYPQNADHFEDHVGRRWQRFSRHLPNWRAGIDLLQNYLPLVHRELQGKE